MTFPFYQSSTIIHKSQLDKVYKFFILLFMYYGNFNFPVVQYCHLYSRQTATIRMSTLKFDSQNYDICPQKSL